MTANFHITASSISGTNPSNQPIESKHKREKRDFYGICILCKLIIILKIKLQTLNGMLLEIKV